MIFATTENRNDTKKNISVGRRKVDIRTQLKELREEREETL